MTCPVCAREIETLDSVLGRQSMEEGKIVRERAFVFHYNPKFQKECKASRKTVTQAVAAAFPAETRP